MVTTKHEKSYGVHIVALNMQDEAPILEALEQQKELEHKEQKLFVNY